MLEDRETAAAFAREFLERYTAVGFGALPKREVDLLVLDLLQKHDPSFAGLNDFDAALKLRTTKRRLRGLRDDISYRNLHDEAALKARLREELKHAEVLASDPGMVKVQIDDAVLRNFAESLVRREFGLVDSSFNSAILQLSGQKFLLLAYLVLDEAERAEADRTVAGLVPETKGAGGGGGGQSAFALFRESFIKAAGAELGEMFVSGAVALVTGGASVILDAGKPSKLPKGSISAALETAVKFFSKEKS